MRRPAPLRPELASVCRYVGPIRSQRMVRPTARAGQRGILAELAEARGLA